MYNLPWKIYGQNFRKKLSPFSTFPYVDRFFNFLGYVRVGVNFLLRNLEKFSIKETIQKFNTKIIKKLEKLKSHKTHSRAMFSCSI